MKLSASLFSQMPQCSSWSVEQAARRGRHRATDAGSSGGHVDAACQRRFEWIYETFLSWASVRFPRLFSSWSRAPRLRPAVASNHGWRRGPAARWGHHTRGFSAALQPTKRMCVAAENAEGRRTCSGSGGSWFLGTRHYPKPHQ